MKLPLPPQMEQRLFFKVGWSSHVGQTKTSMSLHLTPLAFPKIPAAWSFLCQLTDVSTTIAGFKEPPTDKRGARRR